ncbi:unnamed protein product [Trichobilharzia regenti]|nr:unnamed protein product [Trichobilharzia regenti]
MPGTQCIEMSKFSGLDGSDVSYTPILPKPTDLQPVKKTRGRKPLNRGNETDKQRQQKQRKGHEVEATAKEDQSDNTPDRSVFATPTVKRPRGRAPKKPKTDTETNINIAPDPFAIEGVDGTSDTKTDESPASDGRKRRASIRPVEVRKKRKYRKSLKFSSDVVNESSSTLQSPELTSPDSTNATETVTKVKVVRARPRPKKRRPLPTLIRRKKRSAFYGDDSGSEPEVSSRAASRVSEVRLQSVGVNDANSVSACLRFRCILL